MDSYSEENERSNGTIRIEAALAQKGIMERFMRHLAVLLQKSSASSFLQMLSIFFSEAVPVGLVKG
jgi:hypothetical protein